MLAARRVPRIARSFATVADSVGYKVAAVDANQPTSSVTFLVKAGSRFETKPGAAHVLKNFSFKSSAFRSALGTIRQSELYGGVLSASLGREHLALTAEFLRGDEEFFVQLLAEYVQSAKFTRHEFQEYVTPVVEAESTQASSDPAVYAVELAHALAFRNGLGSSLFATPHSPLTVEDVSAFAKKAFTRENIAVLGTGIDQGTLSELVQRFSGAAKSTGTASSTSASSYFGGETRLQAHGGPETVFIGFGTTGAPSPDLAAFSAYLSPTPSIKWSQGLSPIASAIPAGTSVQSVYLPYSDASLFGLLVQGPSGASVKEAGKVAVQALKAAAQGLSKEDAAKAAAKAKFAAASAIEGRDSFINVLGSKVLAGSDASVNAVLEPFSSVTAASVSKAASTLVSAKPTFVAVGDIASLPYADELGL
ncbi:Metalloenzyme, LuxS/M16 peptidase-like protein [Armillaria borealis]|uniref:Cytochrome b-c1 complex subunit 2, mitochondrial n=1 Tax=Armillaria borealis TaxID=47425 RepID=A0AA39JDQ8_9AGAR|nr:Metalloenzyme, LuxS/M16 peptidase-like protein [Armillaria borealis]